MEYAIETHNIKKSFVQRVKGKAVVTSLQLPLTLLAGVLLPLSMGPQWLQFMAHFNPMYYVVEASRVLGNGILDSMKVWQAFIVMIPLTAIVLWWSTRVYHKAVS